MPGCTWKHHRVEKMLKWLTVYFQLLLIITVQNTAQSLSCDPGEESKPYNFTFNFTVSNATYFWYKQETPFAACATSNSSQCYVYPNYSRIYTAYATDQTLVLNIVNVTRESAGNYSCRYSASSSITVSSCGFSVYARPQSIFCQQPELQADNVKVVCTVEKIYPSPVCQFSWIRNDTEMSVTQTITYQNLSVQGQPEYFYMTCSLTVPIQDLGLGSHAFNVTAYPNITGQASDIEYGRNSKKTYPVTINFPAVKLESCPDSYVLEDSHISCTCRDTSNNFSIANTSFSSGSTTLSSGAGYTKYNFTAGRHMGRFTCQAKLLNWTSVPVPWTPQVAYGPDNVSVQVVYNSKETDFINLCEKSQSVEVIANCSVPENAVNPGAVFQFVINGTQMSANPSNSSTQTYSVTKAGPLSVRCTGNNSQFLSVSATSQEAQIEVREPPPGPPIIDKYLESSTPVNGTVNLLEVPEGINKVRCRVEGGYPSVSNLSLDCGTQKNTSVGNVVFLDINVTRHLDSSECSCTAVHSSSCYKTNKTAKKLDVLFEPTVVSFNATGPSMDKIIERNSDVVFSCEAEGNPSPVLSLRKEGIQLGSYSDPAKKFNLLLKVNKTMTDCNDTGVYVCQAQEGQTVRNKTVDVYVKCMQQFDDSVKQHTVYQARGNNNINIIIPVFGYPEPTLQLEGDIYDLDKEDYNLTYIIQVPPYGAVSLRMVTRSVTVFQNYSLNITNTEGSLVYYFQIKDGDPTPPSEVPENVGAIVGGIIAGILVIVAAVLIVFCLKRKGILATRKGNKDSNAPLYKLSENNETEHHAASTSRPESEEFVVDNLIYNMQDKSDEVTIDNSDLYNMNHADSVTVDNSDIYNMQDKSDEVTIDNSEIYNMNRIDQVTIDNSDLYNMNRIDPGPVRNNSQYRNYSDITPTITSAATAPMNMRTIKEQDTSNPYEDVGSSALSSGSDVKSKPSTAPKPKPAAKPRPGNLGHGSASQQDKQGLQKKNSKADQIYSQVVKVPKAGSGKSFVTKQDEDDFFPDPSQQPNVPEKKYEKADKDYVNEKKKFKAYDNVAAPADPSSFGYANLGFSVPEDDINVYSTTSD